MAFNLRLPAAMKVLVTGGSGVVGQSAVSMLLQRGFGVRLLARGAAEDVKAWASGVEAWPGDLRSKASLAGSADGCDVVLHLVGIVDEKPPELTFDSVNVEGTRHVIAEATRAGVKRFVFVSSLGVDRGESPYHRSKAAAEEIVKRFAGEWVIVRPGAVYGPGDEHLSVMLRMVRTLPVVPSIGDGNQRFQPIWHEDLARALAAAVDHPSVASRVLEVGGAEVITQRALIDRMQALTERKVPTVPVPEFLANLGLRAMNAAGIGAPIAESQLDMLREENIIPEGRQNALVELGVTPTPLAEGLRRFVDEQEIQLPDEGVGALQQKTFVVDVRPAAYDAPRLFDYLRDHLLDLMPSLVDANPESSNPSRIYEGATLTLALPLRGHVQVRAAEVSDGRITLMTLQGHPLAGAVRFIILPIEGGVHFEIQVYDRPANVIDWVFMRPIGDQMQETTWRQLAESVAKVAGDPHPDVKQIVRDLGTEGATQVEDWAKDLALRLQRKSHSADVTGSAPRTPGDSGSGQTIYRSDPPGP
jgi:nucleoside-diphosphate-sugar epimerase